MRLTLLLLALPLLGCPTDDDDDSGDDDDSAANDDDAADDDDAAPPGSVIFSAMGDVPYSITGVEVLTEQVQQHNASSPSSFAVHLGDIKSGFGPCLESIYSSTANLLLGLDVPTFMLPGDNEWNDCADPAAAWVFWEQYFGEFEQNWAAAPPVEHQDVRNENFAWVQDGVLFVGLNLVGGAVHDPNEWELRLGQNADWVDAQLAEHGDAVHAAVVFGHASPTPTHSVFMDRFHPAVEAFGKPVLYLHADGHVFEEQNPYFEDNLWRVQVDEGGVAVPLQITVLPEGVAPFVLEREPF